MPTLVDRIGETVEKLRNDPTAGVANPSVTARLANGRSVRRDLLFLVR